MATMTIIPEHAGICDFDLLTEEAKRLLAETPSGEFVLRATRGALKDDLCWELVPRG